MNIEILSKNISNNLKNELNLNEDERSIIEYGLFAIINMIISIALVAIIGFIFNVMIEALIISFTGAILRKTSGGAHASNPTNCAILGTLITVIPAYILKNINLNINYIIFIGIFITIVSIYITYKLAPVDSPNKPIKKEEKIKRLKRKSILILFIYIVIIIFNLSIYCAKKIDLFLVYSTCIYIGILWQVFTLTKYGHILVEKIDILLMKILKLKGGNKNEKN